MKVLAGVCALGVATLASSAARAQDVGRSIAGDDELRAVPVLRLALGPTLAFAAEPHAELAFETALGVSALQGITGGVALNGEAGYMFATGEGSQLHAGHLTLGIGWGALGMAVTYQPRLIVGTYDDDLAIGMRNGVVLHLLADLASIEAGHQFLSTRVPADDVVERGLRHDVRMMFGLNPAAFAYILTSASDVL